MLATAARIVVHEPSPNLDPQHVARAAGVSAHIASALFPDTDALVCALLDQHLEPSGSLVERDLAAMPQPWSLHGFVATVLCSFAKMHATNPAFVNLYLRGPIMPEVARYTLAHNQQLAVWLRKEAIERRLVDPSMPLDVMRFAVDVGLCTLQVAFTHSDRADGDTCTESVQMLARYLGLHAATSPERAHR
jgi:AcrR family transcriptional regulator